MKRAVTKYGLLLVAVWSGTSAAQSIRTGAFVSDVQTGRALDPVEQSVIDPTARFSTESAEIHVSARLRNAAPGTQVKAVFQYIEEGEISIAEAAVEADGNRYVSFTLSRPQQGWQIGRYAVDLYLDGQGVHRQPFVVDVPAGVSRFSDPRFGIAFEVPAAWRRHVTAEGDYLFEAHPGTEQEGLSLRLQFVDRGLDPESSLDDQAGLAESQLKSEPAVERLFRETASVAGQSAPYFIAALKSESPDAGAAIGYTLFVLEGPSYFYWISFHGPGPVYKAHHELFEAILGTIQIE